MSLTLFELLASPVSMLIETLAGVMSAVSSFERIRKYLVQDARTDLDLAENMFGESELTELRGNQSIMTLAVSPTDPTFEWWRTRLQSRSSMTLSGNRQPKRYLHEQPSTWSLSTHIPEFEFEENKESCMVGKHFAAGWNPTQSILSGLDFTIKRTQLTMIIGPVGCGKSTFINALLGETPYVSGDLKRSFADSAYCSQTPWISNGTVRKNVMGVSATDEVWYRSVLHACALDDDIAQLSAGDETVVGSKGATLSGGQQMRLVRAFQPYPKTEVDERTVYCKGGVCSQVSTFPRRHLQRL